MLKNHQQSSKDHSIPSPKPSFQKYQPLWALIDLLCHYILFLGVFFFGPKITYVATSNVKETCVKNSFYAKNVSFCLERTAVALEN